MQPPSVGRPMTWLPTPIVRIARVFRGIGMWVQDETGVEWVTLTIYGSARRCQWCHESFVVGWLSNQRNGDTEVCRRHIVVDWSKPHLEREYSTYIGVGDPIHQRQPQRKNSS